MLIVGNSFIESPVYPSLSAPSLISYKTLSPVNWSFYYSYSPFIELLTQLFSNPERFLSGKKVLVYYFGVEHLTTVNEKSLMLNLRQLDSERILLNNKKLCFSITLSSNVGKEDDQLIEEKIGVLKSETVIKIADNGEWSTRINIANNKIDPTKPMICIVPSVSGVQQTVRLSIGNQTKHIHSPTYVASTRLNALAFELPAGLREITIKAEGKKDSLFAIKNIQIWQ